MENNLKIIETETEYYKQLEIYKKKMSNLTLSAKKMLFAPNILIEDYERLIKEMIYIKLISEEHGKEKLKQLEKELIRYANFKNKSKDYIENIKSKFKFHDGK